MKNWLVTQILTWIVNSGISSCCIDLIPLVLVYCLSLSIFVTFAICEDLVEHLLLFVVVTFTYQ